MASPRLNMFPFLSTWPLAKNLVAIRHCADSTHDEITAVCTGPQRLKLRLASSAKGQSRRRTKHGMAEEQQTSTSQPVGGKAKRKRLANVLG